ncbi:polysaccharide lyase [Aspergillus pseudonomiae]|uniref:Polysaccharide lyase n=1 Tax=Aspergillus pseudonomiae TaxID=1506151 RepID=A0A5N6IGI1_9EURO|nr:polysaccharide lyase [Aspergillus pseudonomiae]KAB8264930.1 polysaccharide lyase [Aspergillus pseudonomiae]KAE8407414.1 polysaccharide lyase [Aspergillus pseudonomiae]
MRFQSVIAALLLSLSFTIHATQTFKNTGTTSGWSSINHEHKGTVQQVTNVVYGGSTALKMTQVYDSSYSGRYHSEVVHNDMYKLGDEGFYGFTFRLQESWQFSPAQSYNIAQFIADFGDTGCDDYMPSSMVWLIGDQLFTRVKTGSVCAQKTTTFGNLATVSPGVWHKIIIQAKWRADGTGYYKMWFDGKKVLEKYNIDTTVDDPRPFQFRVGLYANGWYDDGGMKGTQGTRQVWYDEIVAGTTFADADPDQQ